MEPQSGPSPPEREKGTVKWFSTKVRYGVIKRDSGGDIIVHYTDIRGGFRTLYEGQRVEFAVLNTERGLQAVDVAYLIGED